MDVESLVLHGDVRAALLLLEQESVQCVATSPSYFNLRSYGDDEQETGREETPEKFVEALVDVFRSVRRVLRKDGVVWLNLGDCYAAAGGHTGQGKNSQRKGRSNLAQQNRGTTRVPAGYKAKDLIGVPWMAAFALRSDGWYLRQSVIWHKPNAMPHPVADRPLSDYEYVFLLSKSRRYFYDHEAVKEDATGSGYSAPGQTSQNGNREPVVTNGRKDLHGQALREPDGKRSQRAVWSIPTVPFKEAHFAVFPPALVEPMILAGSAETACGICGAPWKRVVEKTKMKIREGPKRQASKDASLGANSRTAITGTMIAPASSKTIGFEPTCEHNDGSSSSLVLDPFCGSGTAGMVTRRLGRRFVGVELYEEFVEMSRRRIAEVEKKVLAST